MKKLKKKLVPVEELVEIVCTVRGGRIVGLCPNDKGWTEMDITDVVHPHDRERLLSAHAENTRAFWHRVGKEMKLW